MSAAVRLLSSFRSSFKNDATDTEKLLSSKTKLQATETNPRNPSKTGLGAKTAQFFKSLLPSRGRYPVPVKNQVLPGEIFADSRPVPAATQMEVLLPNLYARLRYDFRDQAKPNDVENSVLNRGAGIVLFHAMKKKNLNKFLDDKVITALNTGNSDPHQAIKSIFGSERLSQERADQLCKELRQFLTICKAGMTKSGASDAEQLSLQLAITVLIDHYLYDGLVKKGFGEDYSRKLCNDLATLALTSKEFKNFYNAAQIDDASIIKTSKSEGKRIFKAWMETHPAKQHYSSNKVQK
jgi:hypothetical protein